MVSRTKKTDFFNLKFLLVIISSIMFFLMPYNKGLYFSKDILWFEVLFALIFIIFGFHKFIKKEDFSLKTRIFLAVFLMSVAYIIPLVLFQAVNKYGAFDYILRYLTCFLVFIFFSDNVSSSNKNTFIILNVFAISGVLSSLLTLDSAFGNNINALLKFTGTGSDGYRIFGIMQYGNTSAAYFGLTFYILIALSFLTNNKLLRSIYSALCIPLILAIVLTMSRGAVMVFAPVFILIFLFLHGKTNKIKFILISTVPIVISVLTIFPVFKYMNLILQAISSNSDYAGLRITGFLIVGISILVGFVLSFFANKLENSLNNISDKKYKLIIISLICIAVLSVIIFISTGLYKKVLPETLIERFTLSGTVSENTSGRTDIYSDAIDAIKPHMILGAGGNSWNSIYRMYQRSLYDSAEPHNYILQVWLDSGIFGVLVLAFLCFSILYTCIKNRKKDNGFIITLLTGCSLMLLGHAFIDFDFSYMSMLLMFFAVLGIIDGYAENEYKQNFDFKKLAAALSCVISLFILYNTSNALLARNAAVNANIKFKQSLPSGDVDSMLSALNEMKNAANSDKWNASYRVMEKATDQDVQISLNNMYTVAEQMVASYTSDESKQLLQKIYSLHLEAVEEALALDKYNPIINVNAASFYISVGNVEKGLELVENGIKYNPMGAGRYEELANAYMVIAKNYKENNKTEEAKKLLSRIVNIESEVDKLNKDYAKQKLELTEKTISVINEAKELLK